jgi:hypothetical protein
LTTCAPLDTLTTSKCLPKSAATPRPKSKEAKRKAKVDARRNKRAELRAAGQDSAAAAKRALAEERAKANAKAREPERTASIQYGALDFGRDMKVTTERKSKPKPGSKMRRTHRALEQAEAHAALLARIKAGDATDVEKERAEAVQWKAALARASGEKVHDDIHKLKKTIKQHEKQKKKSASEWADRKKKVADGIARREKVRNERLEERARLKMERRKRGLGPKPAPVKPSRTKRATPGSGGSGRAGFEGKRHRVN